MNSDYKYCTVLTHKEVQGLSVRRRGMVLPGMVLPGFPYTALIKQS